MPQLDIPISPACPAPPCDGDDTVTAEQISDQMMTTLMQSGNIAQNNFITLQKAIDYDHMENKRMVTLDEAVGVREVASKVTPAGPSPAV